MKLLHSLVGDSIVTVSGENSWTALHEAASVGDDDIVQWLLSVGAAADAVNHAREVPLHIAAPLHD